MSKDKTEHINTEEENNLPAGSGEEIKEEVKNSEEESQPAVEETEGEKEELELEQQKQAKEKEEEEEEDEVDVLRREIEEVKDKHLRLYSEFENYRRRTIKERQELIKTSTEDLVVDLLPVLDDFERAKNAGEEEKSIESLKEGYDLIYQKFSRILKSKGLDPLDDKEGSNFDADLHEAISQIPAPNKKLKGKIVDVVERGYKLNEKVIRFAKVVIGS